MNPDADISMNEHGDLVIRHRDGVSHVTLSAQEMRDLSKNLIERASWLEAIAEYEKTMDATMPPLCGLRPSFGTPQLVDLSARTLADGSPVTEDHREINPATGQQKDYVVLSAEERAKGFIRPVRRTYTHLKCGADTKMSQEIAETYARVEGFYSGTFCFYCRAHFPLSEFVWKGTSEVLT